MVKRKAEKAEGAQGAKEAEGAKEAKGAEGAEGAKTMKRAKTLFYLNALQGLCEDFQIKHPLIPHFGTLILLSFVRGIANLTFDPVNPENGVRNNSTGKMNSTWAKLLKKGVDLLL